VIQYRYATAAMVGSWRETLYQAMVDALNAGQADRSLGNGARIVLREWTTIEKRDEPRNG
jgi:hypothetical protein